MTDNLLRLARQAIWRAMQDEGVPGTLGKADGTILAYKPDGTAYSDRCWARVGAPGHLTEIVVMLAGVARSPDLPVIIADRNGRPTAIHADRTRFDVYYGGRGGADVEPHAWTHGRYGSDALYVTGGMFVPLMARPTEPPSMAVTIEEGWYRYLGTLTRWATGNSADLSSYIPTTTGNPNYARHHFVVLCLNRATNALAVVDGTDSALSPVGTCPFDAADVAAISINAAYWPLAAIWFPQSMTEIRANHIFLDLRLWGGEHLNAQITGIDDLADVDAAAPNHGDALAFNATDGEWEPLDVLTPTEHTAIGNNSPHHAAVTLGNFASRIVTLTDQALTTPVVTANKVYAGPTTGADAAPDWRALANADLPDPLAFKTAASALGIVSGAVTATQNLHTLTSESGTSDDLDTITAAADRTLLLLSATATHTITVKHGTGNISLNGAADFELSGNKSLLLFWNGTAWVDLGAGGGGGAALTVEEIDGTPSVASVSKILVTNGTLTDNGGGEAQLDFGSAATDGSAIHDNEAGEIHAIDAKGTPVDADEIVIEDSADSWAKKRVALSDLPGGAGGAPTDADYVVETANGSLSAESVLGTKVITTAAYASRQAAAKAGRIFLPNDGFYVERDTGAAWAPWGPIFPMTPPPTVANWTWVNQGAATATETQGGICLYSPASAGDNWRILARAAPATPYVVTACILSNRIPVNYSGVAIGWRQSSDGKLCNFITCDAAANLGSLRFNSPTEWNGSYTIMEIKQARGLWWMRISDDGTYRKCWLSVDGQNWIEFHSVGRTDFLTADQITFSLSSNNGTWPCMATLLSWKVT